jgi:hypothetical protein
LQVRELAGEEPEVARRGLLVQQIRLRFVQPGVS